MRSKVESLLQKQCVQWFNLTHATKAELFAVPNGGSRNQIEAANLKREGVKAGVSDLVLVTCSGTIFIELKTPTTYKIGKKGSQIIDKKGGTQSEFQKHFQHKVESLGHKYFVVDNFEDFQVIINNNC